MSPTPVTFASPTAPAAYTLGGDRRGGRRALRHPASSGSSASTSTPRRRRPTLVERLLAAGRFETSAVRVPAVRLPAAGRGRRRPLRRRRRTRSWSGAGADEILDIVAKAFLPAGGSGRGPDPDLRDVPRPDRAARRARARRPAPAARTTAGPWTSGASAAAARDAHARLAVQPEQPDRAAPSRTARSRRSCAGSRPTPADGRREPPIVVLDEAYASSSARSLVGLRATLPAPRRRPDGVSKAYALAGLRVGFAIAAPGGHRPARAVPAARVRLHGRRSTVVTEALRDDGDPRTRTSRGSSASATRLSDGARRGRLGGRAVGDELHARRLRPRPNEPPPSPRPCCAAASCRARSGRPPARPLPAGHRPRPGRERPTDRRGDRDRRRTPATEPTA